MDSPRGEKCPNPKTCDLWVYATGGQGKGWRPDADGVVRIRYYINAEVLPGGVVTPDQIERAMQNVLSIWRAASPVFQLVYLGRTDRPPVRGDGYTVLTPGGSVDLMTDSDGYIVEADIKGGGPTTGHFQYHPCEQADNSCTRTDPNGYGELEDLLIHETGHVFGLGDLLGEGGVNPPPNPGRFLTMYSGPNPSGSRNRVTLGLGDVLGLRALYPCSCPMPPIYDP